MKEIKLKVKTRVTILVPDDSKVEVDKIIENLDCIFSLDDVVVESEIFDIETIA